MEFCAKCGKVGKTIEGLCSKCYRQGKELRLKDIEVKICPQTQKYFYKNSWRSFTELTTVFKKLVHEQIRQPFTITVALPKHVSKPDTKVTAQLTIKLDENEYIVPATIRYVLAGKEKKHSGYYEATLQIRNPRPEVYKDIEQTITTRGNVFIAKVVESKHGRDYYLSSNQFAQALGKKLQRTYGGELKVSSKLHSRDKMTSKNLYRLTVLLRLPKSNIGDIITLDGEKHKIIDFNNKVRLQNIKTGKKTYCNYKEL